MEKLNGWYCYMIPDRGFDLVSRVRNIYRKKIE